MRRELEAGELEAGELEAGDFASGHLVVAAEIAGSETSRIRIRHEGATNKVQAPAAATPRRSR